MPRKRVAIVQSNYIPWKGYFDLIGAVDEFVLLDDVQYTRRDWRNRNRIKTASGPLWLTIPVETRGHYTALIREIAVAGSQWPQQHWKTIQHHYARAAGFASVREFLADLYHRATGFRMLSDINRLFLIEIGHYLGIATTIRRSTEFEMVEGKNERLISICRQLGATAYLSGPAARGYLDETAFRDGGIDVEWADYSGYPEYPQLHPPFDHFVSIIDLLLNTGADAPRFMKIEERKRSAPCEVSTT